MLVRSRGALVLTFALAAVLAGTAVASVTTPGVHRTEEPPWRVQVIVQDRVNLVLLVPVLVIAAAGSFRGARVADLVLPGALMYAVYNLVISAFAVRLNPFFLAYTTGLGLAVYALILHLVKLGREDVPAWFTPTTRVRFAAGVLMTLSVAFGVLWLTELVPAALRGTMPASLGGTGLLTNPVHALDLSVALPTMFLGGLFLWQRRAWGYRLGAALLTFTLLTDVAMVAIVLASRATGLPAEPSVAAAVSVVGVVTAAALVTFLGGLERARAASGHVAASAT